MATVTAEGSVGIRQERGGPLQRRLRRTGTRLHKAPRTYATRGEAEGWLADRAAQDRSRRLGGGRTVRRHHARAYVEKWIEQRQLRSRTQKLYDSMLDRLILPEFG